VGNQFQIDPGTAFQMPKALAKSCGPLGRSSSVRSQQNSIYSSAIGFAVTPMKICMSIGTGSVYVVEIRSDAVLCK